MNCTAVEEKVPLLGRSDQMIHSEGKRNKLPLSNCNNFTLILQALAFIAAVRFGDNSSR